MNSAAKRILTALILLTIFALALSLRFYGVDWGFKDGYGSQHPDEWHYDSCGHEDLRPQWLTADERNLPWQDQLRILYEKNLKVVEGQSKPGNPGLKIRNYNYGTFPLYLYVLYQTYLEKHFNAEQGWIFLAFPDLLSGVLLAFALLLGLRMFRGLSRDLRDIDGRRIPWYHDELRLMFFFPCLIIPVTGLVLAAYIPNLLVNLTQYSGNLPFLIIGRSVTAYAGAATVLLVYLIGRDAYNRAAGLIAAAMLATAMLHVQTSHFATTDVILGFLTTGAVYCFLKISQKPRLLWYVLGAICTGFAVGTKWSGVTLPGILFIAHALATLGDRRNGKTGRWIHSVWLILTGLALTHFFLATRSSNPPVNVTMAAFRDFYWNHYWTFFTIKTILFLASIYLLILRKRWHGGEIGWLRPAFQIYIPWAWLSVAIIVGFAAFMVAEPMAYFDAQKFGESIAEQAGINATGERPMVYTQQYLNTLPILYSLDNLFYPSLDWLTAFFVIGGCLYGLGRLYKNNTAASDFLLSAWVFPSFILYSCVSSKFPRYMDAVLPVMMVMGGRWIVDLARIQPSVYLPSMPFIGEGWKRAARALGRYGGAAALICGLIYGVSYVGIYNRPHTLVQTGNWIREHMKPESKVTQNSWDNPFGIHIESRDWIRIHENAEEETRNPQERVKYLAGMLNQNDYIVFPSKRGYGTTLQNPTRFAMTNQFLRAFFAEQLGFRIAKVIDNPPRFLGWEFRADAEDETAEIYDHPKVVIFEKTEKYSKEKLEDLILNPPDWVNEISASEILNLRDGHPVYSPPPGHPALCWAAILYLLGSIAFVLLFPITAYLPDRGYGISKIIGLALFAWISWFLASVGIMPVSKMQGVFVLAGLLLIAAFILRGYGKAMREFLSQKWISLIGLEILFLAIWGIFLIIRMNHPAAIGGEKPMNMAFINAVYRAETFPPEDPWICGYPVNYYYYGQAIFSLAGRFAGLPPEYLFNIGGTCVTGLAALAIFSLAFALSRKIWVSLFATYLSCFAGHFLSYLNFVKFELQRNNRLAEGASIGVRDCISAFYPIVLQMWHAILYYTGFASPEIVESFRQFNYNQLFWDASRVIPNTVANEFPYWTHLFLDFHAHMLVIPFTFAFMVLLYNYFAQPRDTFRLGTMAGTTFFLGLLFGTVICTNTWDLPALGIALLLITAVKFYREADWFGKPAIRPGTTTPDSLHRFLQFPIAPVIAIAAFSVFMFIPFHTHFISRVNSVGVMTEGNTLITTYLGFWSHLLLPIGAAAILFVVARADGRASIKRAMLFTVFFIISVATAIWITHTHPFYHPQPNPLSFRFFAILGTILLIVWIFSLVMWWRIQQFKYKLVSLLVFAILALDVLTLIAHSAITSPWFTWYTQFYSSNPFHFPPTRDPNFPLNYSIVGLFLPILLVFFLMLWRRAQSPEFAFACLLAVLGLGLSLGIEVFYIKEYWTEPTHRWNTVFKFNLQVWHYLSIAAAMSCVWVWKKIEEISRQAGRWFGYAVKLDFLFVMILVLLPTLPFAVLAPVLATKASGYNSDLREPKPTLDGLAWLRKENNGSYKAVQWCNRFLAGRPHIAEISYRHGGDHARFSSYTGLPAIIGWPHHTRERMHYVNYQIDQRVYDMERIYTSTDPQEVFRLAGQYDLQYLVFGQIERETQRGDQNNLPPLGNAGLKRIEGMGGIFQLIYRNEDTSLFQINRSLNRVVGMKNGQEIIDAPPLPPALRPPEPGMSLLSSESGTHNGQFQEPRGLIADATGNIYVADTRNYRLQVFRPDGSYAWQVGEQGAEDSQFNEPNDAAIDPLTGDIFIIDTWNHRVVLFNANGSLLGTAALGFFGPRGIVFHPQTRLLYITDTGNHRVVVMTPDGKLQQAWGSKGEDEQSFREPVGIDAAPDGNILILDSLNKRVKIYTPQGELAGGWPIQTTWDGTVGFEGHIACAPDGTIYLTDPNEASVHIYNASGELQEKLDSDIQNQKLRKPVGIAVTPQGFVLVSDIVRNQVVRVR